MSWWLRWDSPVQIRSFQGAFGSNGTRVSIYVTSSFPFALGDSRLLCRGDIWPEGAFNCDFTLSGTYLVITVANGEKVTDF